MNFFSASLRLGGILFLFTLATTAQTIPTPKDTLGFTPGDDRKLASWAQVVDYFKKLDAASDRVMFEEIGKTTMGAPFVYATISSPENLKNLAKYKEINDYLADPRKIGTRTLLSATGDASSAVSGGNSYLAGGTGDADKSVRVPTLIKQGKTIVLITHGIHSTEVGSTLSSMLIAHRLASSNAPDIRKILDNTIILMVPSLNPDGVDIVKNWYDKTLGTKFEGTEPPVLYHKYVGHDNNRDWYAFTQVETQLTVDKIHNVWHPQIVHDIHQQGEFGSRMFLPPYMRPVEPNVPKQIVEGYTELGNYMAGEMRKKGFAGITTNSTYDAWTPARAYSHYHGGVRILSETASARLASPMTVKFEDLRAGGDDGYDPKKESDNFGPVWKAGEWKLRNIIDYMTTAAFTLLNHAADNRERWLSRFYEIGKEAVRSRKDGEISAYALFDSHDNDELPQVLERGDVEFEETLIENFNDKGDIVLLVKMDQPYGAFAKALLESQAYPNLKDGRGNPIAPYDVTAHTLSLLFGETVRPIQGKIRYSKNGFGRGYPSQLGCAGQAKGITAKLYRSEIPVMDEGWTRYIFQNFGRFTIRHNTDGTCTRLNAEEIRNEGLRRIGVSGSSTTIIFPDQPPAQILNGYPKGTMPDEYTGGVGKEGVENLRKFVEAGGTLVFLNRSSEFAIEQFKLPVKDVTAGLTRKEFYIPGSILRTELDLTHPIAKGMPKESIAWFENSPAFEIDQATMADKSVPPAAAGRSTSASDNAASTAQLHSTAAAGGTDNIGVRIIARYPSDPKQILLSGWALGAEKIAGKAALVEFTVGKGKIVLFGFRPQYRGQSLATFPLLFNSISQ
ncbi:MAG: M14 family metallopeptidase [Pyrinomonadaceae bacterium]